MTTKEEKISQLTKLLGSDELAAEVLKQADATEKQAQDRGLKYKQADTPAVAAETDKAKKADDEPDEDDMPAMDEATKKSYDMMLPHIVKAIHNLTKKSNIEGASKEQRKAAKKEAKRAAKREKEFDEMKVKIDQIAAVVAELNGDMPKALQGGFRATQSDANLIELTPTMKQGQTPDPLGAFMQEMFKFQGNNGQQ